MIVLSQCEDVEGHLFLGVLVVYEPGLIGIGVNRSLDLRKSLSQPPDTFSFPKDGGGGLQVTHSRCPEHGS